MTLGDNCLNENVVNHYNALNQHTKTLTRDSKVSFTYDTEGLRTSKTVNGEKTVFIWDGDEIVMELSDSGKVQKRYIRGIDPSGHFWKEIANGIKDGFIDTYKGIVESVKDPIGTIKKQFKTKNILKNVLDQ